MKNCILLVLSCMFAFSLAEGYSRTQHLLFFKEYKYRGALQPDGAGLVLLNTYMGTVKYDSKQNIGIVLAEEPLHDFCQGFKNDTIKQKYILSIYNLDVYLFIRITGNCALGAQVREAFLAGAKGVILYDPTGLVRDSPFPKVNVDNIEIPVLIINDLNLGKRFYEVLLGDAFDGAMTLAQIRFSSLQKAAFPKIQYFFSSVQKQSLVFVNSLAQFLKNYDVQQTVSIIPTPMIYNSSEISQICQKESCIEHSLNEIVTNGCYSQGKYCTLHNVNYFKPSDVLDHELFQYELAKISTLEWTKYMKSFLETCVAQAEKNVLQGDLTTCGESILKTSNRPLLNQVLRNVKDSWLQGSDGEIDYKMMNNTSFDKIRKDINSYRVYVWPTTVVNGQILQDSHINVAEHLSMALCKSMSTPSLQCRDLLSVGSLVDHEDKDDQGDDYNNEKAGKVIRPEKKKSVHKAWVITLSLIGGLLLGGLIFYIVRRKHIREMNYQLDKKVKQAVQKYQKFKEVNTYFEELS